MEVTQTQIPDVKIIKPRTFGDERGYFFESFHRDRYAAAGIPGDFVQDNVSHSVRGILRGLHVQHPNAQGKIVQVLQGEAADVAVDVRVGSPWFGRHVLVILSAAGRQQLYIPPGFAHGFLVLSETALFQYKCSQYYHPESEFSLLWNDPALGIPWPLTPSLQPTLSAKDGPGAALTLEEARLQGRLPSFSPSLS